MALYHTVKGPVNYTVVGSPTIVDGVASGFSVNNYLEISSSYSLPLNNLVVHVKFNTGALSVNDLQSVFSYASGSSSVPIGFFITSNHRFAVFYSGKLEGGTTVQYTDILFANTWYEAEFGTVNSIRYFKFGIAGNMQDVTLTEGSDTDFDGNGPSVPSTLGHYGNNNNISFEGSIDLNETYITVNGQPWFGVCPIEVKKHQLMGPVGYTKVGSPTISDGVASGFKSYPDVNSGYFLRVPTFDTSKPYKIFCKIITGADTINGSVIGNGPGFAGTVTLKQSNYNISATAADNSSIFQLTNVSYDNGYVLSNNTEYYVSYEFTGTSYIITLKDTNNTYLINYTYQSSTPVKGGSNIALGVTYADVAYNAWTGSIDLNETYIKVNDKLWFYQPAPTKYIVKDGKLVFADENIYLENDASVARWIDTGVLLDNNSRIVIKAAMSQVYGMRLVGTGRATGAGFGMGTAAGGNYVLFLYESQGPRFYITLNTNPHIYEQNKNKCYLDNVLLNTFTETTFTNTTDTCWIFQRSIDPADYWNGKVYFCKIYSNDVLVRDMVPVPQGMVIGNYTVPSNGMFDMVNQVFYPNAGTGTFTIGRDE